MAAPPLAAGASVCVHSLQARPELNGEIVTLMSFDAATERWICRTSDGGRVALRSANLQPVRAPRAAAPQAAGRIASLPWAHFAGGLIVTLVVGHLFFHSGTTPARPRQPGAQRSAPEASSGFGFPASPDLGANYGPAIVSWLPLLGLATVGLAVWALFVEPAAGPNRLQRTLRQAFARGYANAELPSIPRALSQLSAFHLVLLAVGAMLTWALYTEQLRLDLEMSRLIFLPVVGYILWSNRANMANISPFQLLWMLDLLMRLFRPGGGGGGIGGGYGRGYGGYGHGRRGYRRPTFF
jgi:hypothetical protein